MILSSRLKWGFTLVELLFVVAIMALLALFASSNFRNLIEREAFRQSYRTLLSDFQYAKAYSNRHNRRVSLCPSKDGRQCHSENRWALGWIIFEDPNATFQPQPHHLIRHTTLPKQGRQITIEGDANLALGVNLNRFRRVGRSKTTGLPNGRLILCAPNQPAIHLILNLFGEARLVEQKIPCAT